MRKFKLGNLTELLTATNFKQPQYEGTESRCYMFRKYVVLDRHSPWHKWDNMELRLSIAHRLGADVAQIMEQKDNFIIMERAAGQPLFDVLHPNSNYLPLYERIADAPQEHYDRLVKSILIDTMAGLQIDRAPQNIMYSDKKGFCIIDLSSINKAPRRWRFKSRAKAVGVTLMKMAKIVPDDYRLSIELFDKISTKFRNSIDRYCSKAQTIKYFDAAKALQRAIKFRRGDLKSAVELAKKALNETKQVIICKK